MASCGAKDGGRGSLAMRLRQATRSRRTRALRGREVTTKDGRRSLSVLYSQREPGFLRPILVEFGFGQCVFGDSVCAIECAGIARTILVAGARARLERRRAVPDRAAMPRGIRNCNAYRLVVAGRGHGPHHSLRPGGTRFAVRAASNQIGLKFRHAIMATGSRKGS